ncbi:hypothetical protein H0H93_005001, partial [Arthromyces matolae]
FTVPQSQPAQSASLPFYTRNRFHSNLSPSTFPRVNINLLLSSRNNLLDRTTMVSSSMRVVQCADTSLQNMPTKERNCFLLSPRLTLFSSKLLQSNNLTLMLSRRRLYTRT